MSEKCNFQASSDRIMSNLVDKTHHKRTREGVKTLCGIYAMYGLVNGPEGQRPFAVPPFLIRERPICPRNLKDQRCRYYMAKKITNLVKNRLESVNLTSIQSRNILS